MKLESILNEMPQLIPREVEPEQRKTWLYKNTYMSFNTIDRLFINLDSPKSFLVNGEHIYCFINKKHFNALACVKDKDPSSGDPCFRVITCITFHKDNIDIPNNINNPLQISKVYTEDDYEGSGICSFLYASLVVNDYTVISDRVQYLGGMKLWKKLARRANLMEYNVTIWNRKTNSYLTDEHGNIIHYNEKNIPDNEIWFPTDIGKYILLVMNK